MNSDDELVAALAERNIALVDLDLRDAQKMFPSASGHALLIAMHKARYGCNGMPDALRHDSAEWLRARGYGAMFGPLLPKGQLPK